MKENAMEHLEIERKECSQQEEMKKLKNIGLGF
jgi:hypothetical protein